MTFKKLLIGVVFLLFGSFDIMAQSYDFKNFDENDGIEHPFIQSVAEDSTGYVWIGTTEGLYRYDGLYFDEFKKDVNDSLSLSDDNISSLYVDQDKTTLWIGTNFGGVNRLNLKTNQFERLQRNANQIHKAGIGPVQSIVRYNSWLFIGTKENGLLLYNVQTKVFQDVKINRQSDAYSVKDIVNRNGIITIATSLGLYEYDLLKLKNRNYHLTKASYCKCTKKINSLTIENDSTLLLCTNTQLLRRSITQKHPKVLYESGKEDAHLTKHIVDEEGNIWLGTYGDGLVKFSNDEKQWFKSEERIGSLTNNWVTSLLFLDKQNMVWVGTKDGLSMLDDGSKRFKSFRANNIKGRLTDNIFFLFKDSEQQYWWWSFNGLFVHKSDEKPRKFSASNGAFFQSDTITCGYEDENKQLWLGTYRGILKVGIKDETCRRINFEEGYNTKYNAVTSIVESSNDNIWIVTYSGVIKYNFSTNLYEKYPFPKSFLKHNRVKTSDIIVGKTGNLWIGDKNGYLILFDVKSQEYTRYSTALTNNNGTLYYNSILDIHLKDDNNIWLGTFGSGLLNFNCETKKVSPVSPDELLNGNIYSIYLGADGYYWMNTNSKILRYSPNENAILSFGRNDGTLCREFNDGSHHVTLDGTILMGGFGGFVEFKPKEFSYNTVKPTIEISSYSLDNKHSLVGGQVYYNIEYRNGDTLVVSTDQDNVQFYASVLNFQNPNKNMVAWMLEGYDQEWDTLMAYASKQYNALPEGEYTLRLRGCNNDQLWNNVGDQLHVIVKPQFFDSKLFKGLALAFSLVLLYLFYYLRTRYLIKQKARLEKVIYKRTQQLQDSKDDLEESKTEVVAQKQELERHRYYLEDLVKERTVDLELAKERAIKADQLKSAFLANLSHEIRTPMNSIVGFSTLLISDLYDQEERKEFGELVQKSSDSLLVLINDIIDISRIETGQVNLLYSHFGIKEHCSSVFKSLTFNDVSDNVQFLFDLDEVNESDQIYSDPERLKQILVNLLSNALKFTTEGKVLLKVLTSKLVGDYMKGYPGNADLSNDFFLFVIEDTGMGIDPKYHEEIFMPFRKVDEGPDLHGGIGLGLSIVKQLVEMLGGEIWVESQLDVGTTFYFYIPQNIANVKAQKKVNHYS